MACFVCILNNLGKIQPQSVSTDLDVDAIIWVGMLQMYIWNQEDLPKEIEDDWICFDFSNNVKIKKILACYSVSFSQGSSTQAKYYQYHSLIYLFIQ